MADRLTIDILQSLTPFHTDGTDNVTKASRDLLLSLVKSEPRIHDIFFPNFVAPPETKLVDLRSFPLTTFATLFLAEAITKLKDPYNFHDAVSEGVVGNKLREIYESLQWKKLGFQIYTLVYPEVVKDAKTNVSLRDFMTSDGHIWAEKLVNRVYELSWTRAIQQKIVKGKYSEQMYNRDMNALFVKLHLLDPQSVIPAYHYLLNQRALPIVNLELATRNYLEGPMDCSVILRDVENAEHKSSIPVHFSRLSLNTDVDVHHGIEVDEFIVTECRNLGLWAGTRPDNFKSVKAKDRCLMM